MTQTTILMPEGRQRYFDNDGRPAAGCYLYTYAAGTVTPKATYSDSAGVTQNANPIVLDAKGEAVIYWTGAYKVDLKTAAGVQITGYPVDNIKTDPAGLWGIFATLLSSVGSSILGFIQVGVGAILRTIQDELRQTVRIEQFGGVGDDSTINDDALMAAITSIKSDGKSIGGVMTYNTGRIKFGKGRFRVSHSVLDLLDCLNLTFEGVGSRNYFSYWKSPTALVIDGTGSDSSSFGIKLTANNSRNFALRNMSIEYDNSFAGDLILSTAPGLMIDRAFLGSTLNSSDRTYTCQNLIHASEGHHYRIFHSTLSDAVRGIFADNASAPNTNGWSIIGSTFYDFTYAAIDASAPSGFGMDISGCEFDPVDPDNTPQYMVRSTMYGTSIKGCTFAGSDLVNCPSVAWISVQEGVADISGNTLWGQDALAVEVTAGRADFSANTLFCSKGIKVTGTGNLSGGNNRYSHTGAGTTDTAVELAPESICTTNIGPDYFSSGFKNSYVIGGGSSIEGHINYSPDADNSTNGISYTNSRGSIRIDSLYTHLDDSTTAGLLTAKMSGRTLNAVGTWTLPTVATTAGQMEFSFFKSTTGTDTINVSSGATIYDGTGKTGIANSTSEVGAWIKLRALSDTIWVVTEKIGTWA